MSQRNYTLPLLNCFPEIYILLRTKVLGDRNAIEILANLTVMDGGYVEKED